MKFLVVSTTIKDELETQVLALSPETSKLGSVFLRPDFCELLETCHVYRSITQLFLSIRLPGLFHISPIKSPRMAKLHPQRVKDIIPDFHKLHLL